MCLVVIASAAKQSILPLRGKMDCFASLAMTARLDGLLRGACRRARIRAARWLAMTERIGANAQPGNACLSLESQ